MRLSQGRAPRQKSCVRGRFGSSHGLKWSVVEVKQEGPDRDCIILVVLPGIACTSAEANMSHAQRNDHRSPLCLQLNTIAGTTIQIHVPVSI